MTSLTSTHKAKSSAEPNTRQQIIEFSADKLRSQGFEGFSYLDISRHMGITKASVHHHFPKKVDLGLALCDWTQDWIEQGLEHFDNKGTSSWNKLERYMRAAVKHSLTENRMCPISAFYGDLNKLPEPIQQRLLELDNYELNWVANVIKEGVRNGEFKITPPDDPQQTPEALAGLFIFSCKGALHYAQLHGEAIFQQTMKQFECLLKP